MATEPPTYFEMTVKEDPAGTVRVGELRPLEEVQGK